MVSSLQVKLLELLIPKQKLLDLTKQGAQSILVKLVELNQLVKIIIQLHLLMVHS